MSLALRQECQFYINSHGLNDYHADISKELNLVLLCDCGTLLLTVPGIKFSRRSPNKTEIEYATVLLRTFLDKKAKEISNVVNKINKFKSLPIPQLPKDVTECYRYRNSNELRKFNWDTGLFDTYFSITQNLTVSDFKFSTDMPIADFSKFKFPYKEFSLITKKVIDYCEYNLKQEELDQEKLTLSNCIS